MCYEIGRIQTPITGNYMRAWHRISSIFFLSVAWETYFATFKFNLLTRAWPGGGAFNAPLPNIRDSSNTNSAIDVKLGRPSHTTIWHRPWKCFWNPSEIFEIWSILWRHYTPLLVENWPNFASLWMTQFLMKTQMENTKRRKMRRSTRWLSRFFKILGFWSLKFQKTIFFKWTLKSKIFKIFKKP